MRGVEVGQNDVAGFRGKLLSLRLHDGFIVSALWDEKSVNGSVFSPRSETLTLRTFMPEQKRAVSAEKKTFYYFRRAEDAREEAEDPGKISDI